ncbi:hypothetical protein D9758_009618 [Tetrapyrgos nigripes]|uniref:Uncharacterized protein n=1 Tax=Tetrapyrgos nigripes TaxID=182062 RepID=A0A8H5GCS8_9AGAR|nr:hypothetical protein D9758_009618 [Tetrapyrgos nigripes]
MLGYPSALAPVGNSAVGVTFRSERYQKRLQDTVFSIFDTVGLNEGKDGKVAAVQAIQNLYRLLRGLDRVNLLGYVMQGSRFTPETIKNYEVFYEIMCEKKVPVLAIFTHLENEENMDAWWGRNEVIFERAKMKFDGVVCITATEGKQGIFREEYEESIAKLEGAVLQGYHREGWTPEYGSKVSWFQHVLSSMAKKLNSTFKARIRSESDNIYMALMRVGDFKEKEAREVAKGIRKQTEGEIADAEFEAERLRRRTRGMNNM